MPKEFRETGQHMLFVGKPVKEINRKYKRLFKWGFTVESRTLSPLKKPYTATFEVYILKPTYTDLAVALEKKKPTTPAVWVKFYNTDYAFQDLSLEEFLKSPFSRMLGEEALDALKEAYETAAEMTEKMLDVLSKDGD